MSVTAALTTLDLGYNQLGPTGGAAIAKALKVNAVLTELDLSDTPIEQATPKRRLCSCHMNPNSATT